jgi:hypothetical protein
MTYLNYAVCTHSLLKGLKGSVASSGNYNWVFGISRCGDQNPGDFLIFRNKVSENHRGHRVTQRVLKIKITTLCDPLRSRWFNLPYHNRSLQKSGKVHATRITREPYNCRSIETMEATHG